MKENRTMTLVTKCVVHGIIPFKVLVHVMAQAKQHTKQWMTVQ
jgi:hypothetical protein